MLCRHQKLFRQTAPGFGKERHGQNLEREERQNVGAPRMSELLSNLVFEVFGSCSDLVVLCGFNSVFKFDACDDFGQIVKAA
jgi:hypothetical protein